MHLEEYIPVYEFSEKHQIQIHAPAQRVYDSVKDLDMGESPWIKPLFRIRSIPLRMFKSTSEAGEFGMGLTDMLDNGFVELMDDPPREYVMGVVGRFWNPVQETLKMEPDRFKIFNQSGFAKAGFNFKVDELAQGTSRLSTETRVHCMGAIARIRFTFYLGIIRPFSGLIRREMLKIIKRHAEE